MRAIHAARPRPTVLAAGGAILAQLWGFGLGVCDARAVDGPGPGLLDRAGVPALLVPADGEVLPVGRIRRTEPVGALLRDRIRIDGLPLPGQAAAVPDAFAIASVLLPAVPPPSRGDGGSVSGTGPRPAAAPAEPLPPARDDPAPGTGTTVPGMTVPGTSADGIATDGTTADGAPAAASAGLPDGTSGATAAAHLAPRAGAGDDTAADPGDGRPAGPLSAAPVVRAGGHSTVAVAAPIAAGLLLTGLATYRHRGLPRGH
ncbi:hypothetical protein [Kitasatospora sp. NBC_01539]|uniref:hypothetical protein n=1 Tax=Kitasatospora sp. NBC_01539 TaxID=2903577 RepID=UPI00386011A9